MATTPDTPAASLQPFDDFAGAAEATLHHLHDAAPLRLWMVARDAGDYWVAVHVLDRSHVVRDGQIVPVARSAVVRAGDVIEWSPESEAVPTLAEASADAHPPDWGRQPIVHRLRPAAFIGAPIHHADGRVYGTLCGVDPDPVADDLGELAATVTVLARMLATVLAGEMRLHEEERRADRLEMDAHVDELTALSNRRAWDETLMREQSRAERHAHPTTIVCLDIDGLKAVNDRDGHAAGDALITATARAIQQSVRPEDTVARLGGDEFGVVCVDCTRTRGQFVAQRIRHRLDTERLQASIGFATSHPGATLTMTWEEADRLMYEEKQRRSAASAPGPA